MPFIVLSEERKCTSPKLNEASTSAGFLSSSMALKTGCGQHSTPYVLEGKSGQKLNISLLDFSWKDNETDDPSQCASYGYILDTESDDVTTICGNTRRQKHIYISAGHSVQILLESSQLEDNKFIIGFKGICCVKLSINLE